MQMPQPDPGYELRVYHVALLAANGYYMSLDC